MSKLACCALGNANSGPGDGVLVGLGDGDPRSNVYEGERAWFAGGIPAGGVNISLGSILPVRLVFNTWFDYLSISTMLKLHLFL